MLPCSEEHVWTRPVHRDTVNAVADLGILFGEAFRLQATVYRTPRLAAVVRTLDLLPEPVGPLRHGQAVHVTG